MFQYVEKYCSLDMLVKCICDHLVFFLFLVQKSILQPYQQMKIFSINTIICPNYRMVIISSKCLLMLIVLEHGIAFATVMPTNSDSDIILCLQLLSVQVT